VKYKVHPDMNKAAQAALNVLELNANKKHKANTQKALLKWQYKTNDEEEVVPLQVTFWPSAETNGV